MLKYFKASPLWLIGLFIIFAQATAAVAAVKIQGWPQGALVIFVISYSAVVTLIFFLFLWKKPENFYAPSEYGDNLSPESFVNALNGAPSDTIKAVTKIEKNPLNQEALFELLDSLLPEDVKQHLVLMRRSGGEIDISNPDEKGFTHDYEIITRSKGISFGLFDPLQFLGKLEGTNLVNIINDKQNLELTDRGQKFAQWLIDNNKDAETFNSDIGRWGKEQNVQEIIEKHFTE
jgi:hypothetical protein